MTELTAVETAPDDVHSVASSSQVRLLAPAPSFEDVYRQYFGFVWSTLLRLGVSRAAIEDATQDVFVVVHRRLGQFEGRGAGMRSWLFTIVRRVAFRHRRGTQRADRKHRALAQVRARPLELDEALDQRTASARLMQALDQLDHDKRVALDLHVFEGLSGPEIATMLEINVDTAYSRIKAARRRLQRSLEALGVRGDHERLVAAARRETRPPRGSRRKVAAALAVEFQRGAATGVVAGLSGLKVAILAVTVGAVGSLVVVGPKHEPSGDPGGVPAARVASAAADRGPRSESPPRPVSGPLAGLVAPVVPQPARVEAPPPAPNEGGPPRNPTARAAPSPVAMPVSPAVPAAVPASPTGPVGMPASPAVPASPDARLAAEVDLLTRAKRALPEHPQRTLELLATHAEQFPQGQLTTERAGYHAIALCELGRWTAGRGEARRFVGAHPQSSLAGRVTRTCELSDPPR